MPSTILEVFSNLLQPTDTFSLKDYTKSTHESPYFNQKHYVGHNNLTTKFLNKFPNLNHAMETAVVLTENEALIVLCFFFFKKEYESQNELSRDWSSLTQLNANTYFHHAKRPIHELQWIEEIKEARSNRLRLNESFTDDIYYSKVKINQNKSISFFTYCFLKVHYLAPELTIDEKKALIDEAFDFISEIEIMSNISKLEDKIKKNIYKESFFVHYNLIKNGLNDLFYVFSELQEFNENALRAYMLEIKNGKIAFFTKEFLKNRLKKSEKIVNANAEGRNLILLNIKNLITEYETSESNINDKLMDLIKITKELFNDGKAILENFHERKNFISFLYNTVDDCLNEGISV